MLEKSVTVRTEPIARRVATSDLIPRGGGEVPMDVIQVLTILLLVTQVVRIMLQVALLLKELSQKAHRR